jgi:glycosyltransferase involved in cell wall biosynthesis
VRRVNEAVAIIPWGLVIEDFLTPNRLTLEDFCDEFTGSWVFGYAKALRSVGLRPIIVCVSSSVETVGWRTHLPTGTEICLLPVPRTYRILRRAMSAPYGRSVWSTFRGPRAMHVVLFPLLSAAKELAPFLATPVRKLRRELRRASCGVLLCQEYEFPRFDTCVGLSRLSSIRVFGVFQGGDYQRWRLERIVRPRTIPRAAGLIIPSTTEIERVRRLYAVPPIEQISNPIDLDVWKPSAGERGRSALDIPDRAPVVAWHGRVSRVQKGLDTLLAAYELVLSDAPDCVLLLLGTGPDSEFVRSRIDERSLRNVVWVDRYLHDPAEIARLLACADVYAFASRHEGFALAPLEAMACGLPVVGTGAGSMIDILEHGEASGGVIVAAEDHRQMARQMVRLLADGQLRVRLGEAARKRSEEFGSRAVGERLEQFLFGVAEGHSG